MFTPIRQARASGEIVQQIERAIFRGVISPGDRLQSERELAEAFGVSRITVRDALRVLEARGLIRVKVGATGGAFVNETSLDRVTESISTMIQLRRMSLSELAEARTVVESAVAEFAAERADEAAVARIAESVERGRKVVRQHPTHTEESMDFHVRLAEGAGNELLLATVKAYRDLLVQAVNDMQSPREPVQRAHEEILEAVRAKDGEGARRLMDEHLRDFEKRLRRWLQQRGETDGHRSHSRKLRLVRVVPRRRAPRP